MKKLYKTVDYVKLSGGFEVLLDGAPAFTPLGKPLVLPTLGLAEAIVAEFRSNAHHLIYIAYAAIDLADERRDAVCNDILSYAETDLICYRAGHIPLLAAQQAELLNPILAWAEHRYAIILEVTEGLMPAPQPADNKTKLALALAQYDPWRLAVLAATTRWLGSLFLALAFTERHITAERAFHLSHLEELYETEQWGQDKEKEAKMQKTREEIGAADHFLQLLD